MKGYAGITTAVASSLVKEESDSIQQLPKAFTECRARLLIAATPRSIRRVDQGLAWAQKGQRLSQATIRNIFAGETEQSRGVIWEAGYTSVLPYA